MNSFHWICEKILLEKFDLHYTIYSIIYQRTRVNATRILPRTQDILFCLFVAHINLHIFIENALRLCAITAYQTVSVLVCTFTGIWRHFIHNSCFVCNSKFNASFVYLQNVHRFAFHSTFSLALFTCAGVQEKHTFKWTMIIINAKCASTNYENRNIFRLDIPHQSRTSSSAAMESIFTSCSQFTFFSWNIFDKAKWTIKRDD